MIRFSKQYTHINQTSACSNESTKKSHGKHNTQIIQTNTMLTKNTHATGFTLSLKNVVDLEGDKAHANICG